MTKREKLQQAIADIAAGREPSGSGLLFHVDRATQKSDYDALNPNSLDTTCRSCSTYYEVAWAEGERPPNLLTCPHCGSHDHESVGSPAGAYHLALWEALWDPDLP